MILSMKAPFLPEGVSLTYDIKYGEVTPDDEAAIESAVRFARRASRDPNAILGLMDTYAGQYDGLGEEGGLAAWRRVHNMLFDMLTPENKELYVKAYPDSYLALRARGVDV